MALACAIATQLGFLCKHQGGERRRGGAGAAAAAQCEGADAFDVVRGGYGDRGGRVVSACGEALAMAPLSMVQAVLATGVIVVAVLGDRLFGCEVPRRQWLGDGMTALGLLALRAHAPGVRRDQRDVRDPDAARLRGRRVAARRLADRRAEAGRALAPTTTARCWARRRASCSGCRTSPSRRSPTSTAARWRCWSRRG